MLLRDELHQGLMNEEVTKGKRTKKKKKTVNKSRIVANLKSQKIARNDCEPRTPKKRKKKGKGVEREKMNTHVPPFNIKLVLIALSFSNTNVASFSVLVTEINFPQKEKKSVNLEVVVSGERPVTC